jgi:hypothetical protein
LPAKSTFFVPSSKKDVSSEPLALKRVIAKSLLPPNVVEPATTTFPSACRAAAWPLSNPPKLTPPFPPAPKLASGEPSGFKRETMKSRLRFPWPAVTILPSGCTSTSFARSTPP